MNATFWKLKQTVTSTLALCAISLAALGIFNSPGLHAAGYTANLLVGDTDFDGNIVDPNLVNAWGMVVLPNNALWVNANGTSLSGIYEADGTPTGTYIEVDDDPSGLVMNKSGFNVSTNGGKGQPSTFIFSTEEGTILGWSSKLNTPNAIVAVDNSDFDAVYKGVAIIGSRLFAADFKNGIVDIYDSKWNWMGAFTDSEVPFGYGPFNVVAINNQLYVSFALIEGEDPDEIDDQPGAGNGFVDVFDSSGRFIKRLVSEGALNSPWGMALAPKGFGTLSGDLLVGNFGDGKINAYNLKTGAFMGTLSDSNGIPIVIDGLWALEFGTQKVGKKSVPVLYFSAGPNGEDDGVVGTIQANP